jgi:hypothetical protein
LNSSREFLQFGRSFSLFRTFVRDSDSLFSVCCNHTYVKYFFFEFSESSDEYTSDDFETDYGTGWTTSDDSGSGSSDSYSQQMFRPFLGWKK